MGRVAAFMRNHREVFESPVVAPDEEHAGTSGKPRRKASRVPVGRSTGQDIGASVAGVQKRIERFLILCAESRERLMKNPGSIRERSDGKAEIILGSGDVPRL